MVEKIVDRALSSLSANGVEINRENWFQEAIEAEKSGAVHCCQSIIKSIIETGIEEEDRKQTWIDDAEFVSSFHSFIQRMLYVLIAIIFDYSALQKVLSTVPVLCTHMHCRYFHRRKAFGCGLPILRRIMVRAKVWKRFSNGLSPIVPNQRCFG